MVTTHNLGDPIDLGYGEISVQTDAESCVRLVDYGDEFWIPNRAFHETSEVPASKSGKVIVKYEWAKEEGWTDEGNP